MDTSNQYLACGIYKDGKLLDSYMKIGTKRQSEDAIPVLYDLTNKHDIDLLQIDEMIITKGPGSYTGVRVAMTIAKTLAAIAPVKIKTVSSLAVYGYQGKKIAIIDARSKKVFACVYKDNKPLSEEKMYSFEELEDLRKNYPDYELTGEVRVLGLENKDVNLVEAMYALGHELAPLENVDVLVPTYIKDVEAKKKCY
jgi:tRNA threonylcarbamoyl adenosine modification protein YeaZ